MPIRFGTDGWRAVISDEFTFANVRLVAEAIADYFIETKGSSPAPVVVGFDTRFLSDRYAMEASRILADLGLHVCLSKAACPTPAMAFAIGELHAMGGIMITASHNPPRYNGIKFKAYHGGPGLPHETARIEQILERNMAQARNAPGNGESVWDMRKDYPGIARFDPMPAYEAHLRNIVDFGCIGASDLSVAVDPMYGAGRRHIASLLRDAGCRITEIHGEMNPGFGGIHPEPIERNLGDLTELMCGGQYDVGLATDGDADRIGAVDADGAFVDPHRIFSLVLRHLVEVRRMRGAVVKTVSTTQLLNRLSGHYGLPLHETPVGFNHICELMLKQDVLIGGEESGGITIRGHVPDGDGILMGLLLVELTAHWRRPLAQIIADLMREHGEFHYGRNDVHTQAFDKKQLTKRLLQEVPKDILGHRVVNVNDRDGVKYVLDDDSWLLIRPSGTEPVLRIYAEARSRADVLPLLTAGAALARV